MQVRARAEKWQARRLDQKWYPHSGVQLWQAGKGKATAVVHLSASVSASSDSNSKRLIRVLANSLHCGSSDWT